MTMQRRLSVTGIVLAALIGGIGYYQMSCYGSSQPQLPLPSSPPRGMIVEAAEP